MNFFILLNFDLVHTDHCPHHAQVSFLQPINLRCFPLLRSGKILRRGKIYRLIEFPGQVIKALCFVFTVCSLVR